MHSPVVHFCAGGVLRANGPTICQPRATPWVSGEKNKALKGRHHRVLASRIGVAFFLLWKRMRIAVMRRILTFLIAAIAIALPASGAGDILREGDTFEMRLSGPPEEFTREFNLVLIVDEGRVKIPFIGSVDAVGLSRMQLAAVIEKRLRDAKVFSVAKVSVGLRADADARFFTVSGGVRSPGKQPWTPGITLTDALAAAGGIVWSSSPMKITRGGKTQTYSRKAIKKDPSLDPKIEPGDIIEVGDD